MFTLLRLEGWNVLFIVYCLFNFGFSECKIRHFLSLPQISDCFFIFKQILIPHILLNRPKRCLIMPNILSLSCLYGIFLLNLHRKSYGGEAGASLCDIKSHSILFKTWNKTFKDMMNAQDIKNGTCIRMDGQLYFVVEFLHVKPGKGNTFMRTKLKNVVDGRVLERRFNIGEKLEDVRVERRPYQFLYTDGGDDIFMNNETFEQVPINKELVTGSAFMKEGDTVEVVSDASTDTVLYAEMPVKTVLKITYTEPGLKGDTATNTLKPATVETGATVRVPLFINEGELIEVDTRSGEYVGRVKA